MHYLVAVSSNFDPLRPAVEERVGRARWVAEPRDPPVGASRPARVVGERRPAFPPTIAGPAALQKTQSSYQKDAECGARYSFLLPALAMVRITLGFRGECL